MTFPSDVYAIYPYDEEGQVAGVYVGSAHNVQHRFNGHLQARTHQKELHDLMRKNGFTFQILGKQNSYKESNLEYDWIDFFKQTNVKVFNSYIREGSFENVCSGFSKPVWNGKGVVWKVKPKQRITHPRAFTQFVRKHGMSLWDVSKKVGLSPSSLYNRLNGLYSFTTEQIKTLNELFPNEPNAIERFIALKGTGNE